MTEREYIEARRQLRRLNRAIEKAPDNAKPVFVGITELHKAVKNYERRHGTK